MSVILPAFAAIVLLSIVVFVLVSRIRPASALTPRIEGVERSIERVEQSLREELRSSRRDIGESVQRLGDSLVRAQSALADAQARQLETSANQLAAFAKATSAEMTQARADAAQALQANTSAMADFAGVQAQQWSGFRQQVDSLRASVDNKVELLRTAVEQRLKDIQQDNAAKLDQMRQTVDEKLQSTLETRLGESFRQVCERLEQVYKGLGEMQVLATGVGDLKRVLSNVKTRGTWGEVQLGTLLEQVLAPDQYAANVATSDAGNERVEFAIRLPGRSGRDETPAWLPIDAKFPIEDYQALLDATDRADVAEIDDAGKRLELRVRSCAKDIATKYVNPPRTTDFAIMFLPNEGLYAEVLKRPGLGEQLQREHRIVIAGPTTLWAILNSLQMGFRTLAIERRSSEVWALLGAVKTEFGKFGTVLDKVQKNLSTAATKIDEARKNTRAIERKLTAVQELPTADAGVLLDGLVVDAEEPALPVAS